MIKKLGKINILFLIAFFILANFITFPLIFHLTNLATGPGDELLIAWNQGWNIYNFTHNLPNILHIFNANLYFPFSNSLAYSDAYFTNSLIALIPVVLLKSPIVATNVNLIISLTLVGFFSFKLTQYLTKNNLISFLSGSLMIFSPAFLAWLVHIQIISIYFVPLAILFLIKYLEYKQNKYFIGFLTCLVLQAYNSFLPAYFIVFAALFICLFFIFKNKNNYKIIFTKQNIFLSVLTFILIAIIAIPYFQVSKQFNYVRDVRDAIHFAIQPEDLLVTNQDSRLYPVLSKLYFSDYTVGLRELHPGFLGVIFSTLSIFAIIFILKNWKKQTFVVKGLFSVAVLGFLLSLGPLLHINRFTIHKPFPIPLPYLLFYYLIPGFNGFRNSARFEIMYMIFILPVIGVFLKEILKKLSNKQSLFIIMVLIIITVLEFNFPLQLYSIPLPKDFPKVYAYLSTIPRTVAVVHMPVYNWNTPHSSNELWRDYYSTSDFRNMLNGASGFSPPPWQNLVENLLANFPLDNSIIKLKSLGINLIVIHKNEYDVLFNEKVRILNKEIASGSAILDKLYVNNKVVLLKIIDNDYVFKIKEGTF
jgi:hypothetical protein